MHAHSFSQHIAPPRVAGTEFAKVHIGSALGWRIGVILRRLVIVRAKGGSRVDFRRIGPEEFGEDSEEFHPRLGVFQQTFLDPPLLALFTDAWGVRLSADD